MLPDSFNFQRNTKRLRLIRGMFHNIWRLQRDWGMSMNTKKVTIRFIEESDAPYIQKYASDEKVARTCNIPHPYPANGGKEHVRPSDFQRA